MNFTRKHLILCTMSSLLLMACGPKNQMEKASTSPQVEQKQASAEKPTSTPQASQEKKNGLTPDEKIKLKIDEENVMDENVPG